LSRVFRLLVSIVSQLVKTAFNITRAAQLDHSREQPSVQPTTVRPYSSSVPPGVKDTFVWLTETPAPSDFCI